MNDYLINFENNLYSTEKPSVNAVGQVLLYNVRDRIKIYNIRSITGYVWNTETLLWQMSYKSIIVNICYNILQNIINRYRNNPRIPIRQQRINKFDRFIRNNRLKILKTVIDELYDEVFITILNKTSDELPIINGRKINLRTGVISDRTILDFWSYECPVDYIPDNDDNEQYIFQYIKGICNEQDLPDSEAVYTHYIIKLFGYCLTRETDDKSVYILQGSCDSSKTTLLTLLQNILQPDRTDFAPKYKNIAEIRHYMQQNDLGRYIVPFRNLQIARMSFCDDVCAKKINIQDIIDITSEKTLHIMDPYIKYNMNDVSRAKFFVVAGTRVKISRSDNGNSDINIRILPFNRRFEYNRENREYVEDIKLNRTSDAFGLFVKAGIKWWQDRTLTLPQQCRVL